jgi:hypothetical protein
MSQLLYRGIRYDSRHPETRTAVPVEHVYRGTHFNAPLHHSPAAVNPHQELHYRGHAYHHTPQAS